MKKYTRLWWALTFVIAGSLAVLGYYGFEIYQKAPPIPTRVVSTDGMTVFTKEQIQNGVNEDEYEAWLSGHDEEPQTMSQLSKGIM